MSAGLTLGNGTEGDLQMHAGALSSTYLMESGAHVAAFAGAGSVAGAAELAAAPAAGPGATDLAAGAAIAPTYGNGTEGDLQAHRTGGVQSSYLLDSGSYKAAYGRSTF